MCSNLWSHVQNTNVFPCALLWRVVYHRNSIVWRRVNLARFPYWPEKRTRVISRYSYLMKTLISSEYGLTISDHVTVLRQWLSEKNTDYIIKWYIPHTYIEIWARPWENLPYGILLTLMLFACTVITFARIAIVQYFEKGIQLLACCIFIVWGIILLIRIFSTVKIQNSALIWKHSIFPKGRLSHGSAQLCFSLSFYIKAKNNDVFISKLKK